MTDSIQEDGVQWLVVSVRLAAEPSRHRVAVWRELRKTGAVSLGQGSWAVPDVPGVAPGMAKARELAARGDGQLVVLQGIGSDAADEAWLRNAFTAQRDDEWTEFIADCGKFDAEIDREIAKQKLTMAELEEEEQSLDRLRRWHRDLTVRDVFGAPLAATGDERLAHCADRLTEFTEQVFQALHQF